MTYDPAALFKELGKRGIEYVLIGGWAVNAHGYRRFTGDVDICPHQTPRTSRVSPNSSARLTVGSLVSESSLSRSFPESRPIRTRSGRAETSA